VESRIAHGQQNDVPTLTGLNADEGSSNPDYGMVPASEFTQQARKRFGELAEGFLKLYRFSNDRQAGEIEKTSAREQGLIPMDLWAARRARTSKAKPFTYYWIHAEPGPDQQRYGAFHTPEVPYVFDTLHQSKRPLDRCGSQTGRFAGLVLDQFCCSGRPQRLWFAAVGRFR